VMLRTPSILSVLAFASCTSVSAGDTAYAVKVRVTSDPGVGLAGVPLRHGQTALGVTGADGSATLQLAGREGDRVEVGARCPDSHMAPEPTPIVLRTYVDRRAPELEIRCTPRNRQLAVVVSAKNGPNLPLMHRGVELARTDAQGIAHFVLVSAPGDAFEITLDTSARDDLRPVNPYHRFVIAGQNSAQLFDPELSVVDKPPPKRPRPRPAASSRPQRI
jgi:hypothetical protein